jgi:hypothetical protein
MRTTSLRTRSGRSAVSPRSSRADGARRKAERGRR